MILNRHRNFLCFLMDSSIIFSIFFRFRHRLAHTCLALSDRELELWLEDSLSRHFERKFLGCWIMLHNSGEDASFVALRLLINKSLPDLSSASKRLSRQATGKFVVKGSCLFFCNRD